MSESLEKLQRTDHDTLIRLESKVDNLVLSASQMTLTMSEKFSDHEARIRVMEKLAERADPDTNLKKLEDISQWVNDYKVRWKSLLAIASVIAGISGFVLQIILGYVFKAR